MYFLSFICTFTDELDDQIDRRENGGLYFRDLVGLLEANERGEEIDINRLHSLELYARHHAGKLSSCTCCDASRLVGCISVPLTVS